ncbi:MAG: bifunctional phosphoribosyl-AMP cyclohydrolase/phosphoribosyl-ATP diphosphatase HisIE [Bacteroidetes bacterium]|nr:bifunctional phosphoribosyl-AMP cyclohydrolase/phosphoribosyl-ATP diphosphatase HisIE [Bacteroidota bacterium]
MKDKFNDNELIPVIIQDMISQQILMLGYMNEEAFQVTIKGQKVCFFSRSKNRLWVKGETSGNFFFWKNYAWDCDQDALIFQVEAVGPACHNGTVSCFEGLLDGSFIHQLENTISQRRNSTDEKSYVSTLSKKGIHKVAQKVGEEAVEVVIEAMSNNDELFLEESADLLFHYLILLQEKGFRLKDVQQVLQKRQKK